MTPPDEAVGGDGANDAARPRLPERDPRVVAVLAALAYGERCGAERAAEIVRLAPDGRSRVEQQNVAHRERQNWELIQERVRELDGEDQVELFAPYFDAFFSHTEPKDWVEAQAFHYVGDAMVSDFADMLMPRVDRVSAVIVRRALGDREALESFALDELTRAMERDPDIADRIRRYSARVVGEAFTQTGRALDAVEGLRSLLEDEGTTRFVILLLDRHRMRLDRLGIEPLDDDE